MSKPAQQGTRPAAYLCLGKESYLVDQAADELVAKHLSLQAQEFELAYFDAGETSPERLLVAMQSLPFLAADQGIVVNNFGVYDGKGQITATVDKAFQAYMTDPNPQCLLILKYVTTDKPKAFVKKLLPHLEVISCDGYSKQSFDEWVKNYFAQAHKHLMPEAMRYVRLHYEKMSLQYLAMEFNKVIAYTIGRDEVSVADLTLMMTPTAEGTIFNLIDAIMDGKVHKGLEYVHACRYLGEKTGQMLWMIGDHFKRLLIVSHLLDTGKGEAQIQKELGKHPFVIKKAVQYAQRISAQRLSQALLLLGDFDYKMKYQTGFDPDASFDELVIMLCHTLATK